MAYLGEKRRQKDDNACMPTLETRVKVLVPMYQPLEVSKCEKCKRVIAEPKELIRIVKSSQIKTSSTEFLFRF